MNMKKLMKKMLVVSIPVVMVLSAGNLAYANTKALPSGTIISKDGARYLTDSKGEKYSGWFLDSNGDWYYFNESDKSMKIGWHHDDKDNYWYYLNLSDGKMVTGWQTIDGKEYFFQPVRDMGNYNFNNEQEKWLYSINSKVPYGAMYVNTTTPDGKKVAEDGKKITSINYSDFIGYYSVLGLNQPTTLAENITISKIENGIVYGDFWHSSDGGYEECDFSSGVVLNEDEFVITVTWEDRGNVLVESDDMSGSFQLHVKLLYDSGKACLYIQSNDGPRTAYNNSPHTYNEKLYVYPEF